MPKMIIIECSDEEADRMVEQLKNMVLNTFLIRLVAHKYKNLKHSIIHLTSFIKYHLL